MTKRKDVRGKIAPEDSSYWKCNWINCEGGAGLAGNGCCSMRGEWNNPRCEYFREASCQHGVKVSKNCRKCDKLNERWKDLEIVPK